MKVCLYHQNNKKMTQVNKHLRLSSEFRHLFLNILHIFKDNCYRHVQRLGTMLYLIVEIQI